MAYPTTIANLVDVVSTDTLLAAGHDARHNEVNTALREIRTLLGDAPQGASATLQARLANLVVGGWTAPVSIDSTTASETITRYSASATDGTPLYIRKSRGAAANTNTIIQNGDEIGSLVFQGANGTSYDTAAQIKAYSDGAPGASADMPGRLEFYTTADASSTPTERMRIDKTGAILKVDTNEGNQSLTAEQFFYLGANGSGITTVATNPYGVSPNLSAYGVYDFEYWLVLANSSTGAVTAGWAATTFTKFNATINVLPLTNGTAYVGINPFIGSTTNKAITGAATAATYILHIRGEITAQNAVARLPFQVSVASGTITPQAGSWFRFVNRGVSASGTSNITVGNVA